MFIWALKNVDYILVALVSFFLGFCVGQQIGQWQGKAEGRAEFKQEVTEEVLKVKVKNAKIRDHRPDHDALIKRLRAHTY